MFRAKSRVRQRRQLEKQAAHKARQVLFPKPEWNNEFKPLFQSNCLSTAPKTSPLHWNHIKCQILDK